MWVTRVSINNPVFATMVMVGIVVLGLFSYARLRVEQNPDVTLPYVQVLTVYPGASPEVVETDVSKPIEYAVNTVSGVKRIYSNSREGQSQAACAGGGRTAAAFCLTHRSLVLRAADSVQRE